MESSKKSQAQQVSEISHPEQKTLEEIRLTATYPFDSKRFHHGPFTNYELALSLRPDSYLSHGSAAFLHGLTDQEPEFIYVNKEQSPKIIAPDLSAKQV